MMPQTITVNNIPTNKIIGTKLPENEYNKIISFVEEGFFLNTEEFVKQAILEKINSMEEIMLRDIPPSQQKREIIEYAKKHKNEILDAEIIATELRLDVFEVDDIMSDLIDEKIIEEIK